MPDPLGKLFRILERNRRSYLSPLRGATVLPPGHLARHRSLISVVPSRAHLQKLNLPLLIKLREAQTEKFYSPFLAPPTTVSISHANSILSQKWANIRSSGKDPMIPPRVSEQSLATAVHRLGPRMGTPASSWDAQKEVHEPHRIALRRTPDDRVPVSAAIAFCDLVAPLFSFFRIPTTESPQIAGGYCVSLRLRQSN